MAKPAVDRLERDLGSDAQILRMNVADSIARTLVQRYGVRGVPTFVLLNGDGEVVLQQVGSLDRGKIESAVAALVAK